MDKIQAGNIEARITEHGWSLIPLDRPGEGLAGVLSGSELEELLDVFQAVIWLLGMSGIAVGATIRKGEDKPLELLFHPPGEEPNADTET